MNAVRIRRVLPPPPPLGKPSDGIASTCGEMTSSADGVTSMTSTCDALSQSDSLSTSQEATPPSEWALDARDSTRPQSTAKDTTIIYIMQYICITIILAPRILRNCVEITQDWAVQWIKSREIIINKKIIIMKNVLKKVARKRFLFGLAWALACVPTQPPPSSHGLDL